MAYHTHWTTHTHTHNSSFCVCGEREKKEKSDDRVRLIWPRARLELSGECLRVVNLVLPPLLLLSSLHSSSIEFQLVQSRQFLFCFFEGSSWSPRGCSWWSPNNGFTTFFKIRIHADFTKKLWRERKRWRTVFPTDKNLSHFLWIKGETGGLVIVIVCARPCHTHTPKTSFLFGVCTFHRSLSLFRLETKSALLCQKNKDDGPQKIRKCVTFQISWKLLFCNLILNLCVFDRRIASREGHVA